MYRSRGEEVNPQRLVFTGDVFEDVPIPNIQGAGLVIVIEHPCAIRGHGGRLNDFVLVAGVSNHDPVGINDWTTGHFDLSPLPDLKEGELYVGEFLKIGRIPTDILKSKPRISCASVFGINLLQQRLVWNLTRCFIPTNTLAEAFTFTYDEADLAEDWTETLCDAEMEVDEAISLFDEFLTQDIGDGQTLQKNLQDIQLRSAVRTSCKLRARTIAATL
jgi:hypothetical protein